MFEAKAAYSGFALAPGVLDKVRALVEAAPRERGPGNVRIMTNLLDRAVSMQGRRVLADGIVDETESSTSSCWRTSRAPSPGAATTSPATRSPRWSG